MLSQGNQIVDNLLFNNAKQISLSDFSNFTGPGAVAPYSMPSYNQTISGNAASFASAWPSPRATRVHR